MLPLNFLFITYSIILNTINLPIFSSSKAIIRCFNQNKKINVSFKLKNKLFFQKYFFKLKFYPESLSTKLLLFLTWINPSYYTLNKLLFNLFRLVQISHKYKGGIQGYTLKFRGKLDKFPRKEKVKISQGSLHRLNIKNKLKNSYDNFFIFKNGTSNVKFFINY